MDLIEFVKARLDEDETIAKAAAHLPGRHWEARSQGDGRERDGVLWDDDLANITAWFDGHMDACVHAARWDPTRVQREVEAKRARLALMAEAHAEMDRLLADKHAGRADQAMAVGRARGATVAVKHDAAIWRDHADYDPAWSPGA